jgi:hypothetical protein
VLNAGVALYAADVAPSIADGIERARPRSLPGAVKKLDQFVAMTKKLGAQRLRRRTFEATKIGHDERHPRGFSRRRPTEWPPRSARPFRRVEGRARATARAISSGPSRRIAQGVRR